MPACAPGRVRERMARPIMMTKSSGIMIFENFSMPFWMPEITISAVASRNTVWHTRGFHGDTVKEENISESAASPPRVKSKQTALMKYSTPQPPTTE